MRRPTVDQRELKYTWSGPFIILNYLIYYRGTNNVSVCLTGKKHYVIRSIIFLLLNQDGWVGVFHSVISKSLDFQSYQRVCPGLQNYTKKLTSLYTLFFKQEDFFRCSTKHISVGKKQCNQICYCPYSLGTVWVVTRFVIKNQVLWGREPWFWQAFSPLTGKALQVRKKGVC